MKKKSFLLLACLVCFFATTTVAEEPLRYGFLNPPPSAKARTWWHWIDGNITKEGITADLEAMKRVGIQEAQIFNVGQGYPDGPVRFLSDEWLDIFRFAVLEANRLGLEIGFHNGAGWSSSGGPWVTPENSMQTVVYSETHYTGGTRIKEKLSQPPSRLNYYKDIAVIAFPTPHNDLKIDSHDRKSLSSYDFPDKLYPDAKEIPQSALISKSTIVDLTSKMSADGTLKWQVPAGEWTILRFGHTTTGTENRPAIAEGRGLECDKLSRAAMDAYWAGGIEPILQKLGSLVGSTLTNCLIDSYEVGCGNWTKDLDKEFLKRCGYDCLTFLPTFAGYYVESGEISERFLWDFRRTVGDMMVDNYYGYFGELCHNRGMKFSIEPYGAPLECLYAGAKGDIPMSEFWVGTSVFRDASKMASSVAHLNGTSIVGAEAFTANGENSRWLNQPSTMKTLGDWAWSEGVNRFIFHTYAHQPWNIAPGMTFHMYGTEISRLNTWWEQGAAYMSYLARSQFLLQQGRCATDVLVFTGEASPNEGIYRADIKELGYDYDEIGTNKIGSLTVKDGVIQTPVGGEYRVLVLPESKWMTPKLAKKIDELVKAGATIIGAKPEKSPSLQGFPACDGEVEKLVEQAWKGVIQDRSVKDVLDDIGLSPDFSAGEHGADLLFIHRIVDDVDVYFVSNQEKRNRTEACTFRVVGKQPELWNPETGKIEKVAAWQSDSEGTNISLSFEPEEAFFIVFKPNSTTSDHIISTTSEMRPIPTLPLPNLKIIKAEYGYFLPEGIVDVTQVLADRIKDGKLQAGANNDLAGDPAPGGVKELKLEYTIGGELRKISIPESRGFTIPVAGETGNFKLVKALYGRFAPNFDGNLPELPDDITQQVSSMIASQTWKIPVDDRLINKPISNEQTDKELRLVYSVEEETYKMATPVGREADLTVYNPEPRFAVADNKLTWITPQAGNIAATTNLGTTLTAQVKKISKPIEITGTWDVSFPPNLGVLAEVKFHKLNSWSESIDEGIRYFSGTATYRKQIIIPKEYVQSGKSLELDLGRVRSFAEVIVNGENLGILWKEPFRIDLGSTVKEGKNDIEIRITNLWPNRLIGDAHYPEDCEWNDWLPKSWPDWLLNNTERPSERTSFTTWKHWGADDALLPSGLLGPVILRPYVHVTLSK